MFTNEAVQTITTNSCGAMFDHFGPALHDDDDDRDDDPVPDTHSAHGNLLRAPPAARA